MHRGHMSCITKAMHDNDHVYVIVCGYDNDPRAKECGINLNERTRIIQNFYYNEPRISVFSVNDTTLGIDQSQCEKNWEIWTNSVERIIKDKEHTDYDITYYISEKHYEEMLNQVGKKTYLMDRILGISGTEIRKNPHKYWKYIAKPFKKYFVKKFAVIGTASEGKTTLCRKISNYFDIPWVPELARDYIKENNIQSDEEFEYYDFSQFLYMQYNGIKNAIKKASEQSGIMISDTETLVTLMYAKAYSEMSQMSITKDDYKRLEKAAEEHYLNKTDIFDWDIIFLIMPNENTQFEDDGSRYMKQSSYDERIKNFNILHDLLLKYYPNTKIIYMDGSEYEANFECIKGHINKLGI